MRPPKQQRGVSKQDYQTPPEFLEAVLRRWDLTDFDADLSASHENAVTAPYYTIEDDGLSQPWKLGDGYNWLNPEFKRIQPWVRKAWLEWQDHRARTFVLVPAGVGSNWFRDWAFQKARIYVLNGRLTFVGCPNPYPKDLLLLLYGADPGFEVWDWRPRSAVGLTLRQT